MKSLVGYMDAFKTEGAVEPLVGMLYGDPSKATMLLASLITTRATGAHDNAAKIVAAGGVTRLVNLVASDDKPLQIYALEVLTSLIRNDNRTVDLIVTNDTILPKLATLLKARDFRSICDATGRIA